ncbi:hypothetical protein [Clostridium facile]|uniref:dTDP-4-amino-4,6-dideoxygalactose transaminase n=1 Tax=Clostridium facile TaxID=2763035 RepID=A0ABR7INH0_9CLOT|nr:hypothetical protein [Clostridium facile]MBC5786685.1 hypothetical protein [Clostridium facile]
MEIGSIIEFDSVEKYENSVKPFFSLPFMDESNFRWNINLYETGRNAIEDLGIYLRVKKGISNIAIPDYVCHTVTDSLKRSGLSYVRYHIQKGLRYDISEIEKLTKDGIQCIYIVHYFGKKLPKDILKQLNNLKIQGITIIEDITLSLLSNDKDGIGFGDYVIGSLRKWFPIPDGGILLTSKEHELPIIPHASGVSKYAYYYLIAQQWKRQYVTNGYKNKENKRIFLDYYSKAMKDLFEDYTIRPITEISKRYLEQCDFIQIAKQRAKNYDILYSRLSTIPCLNLLVERNKNYVPLGMVILSDNRDKLLMYLIQNGIYCNVHWRLGEEVSGYCRELSRRAITIPCDQRYNAKEMNYIADKIEEWFNVYL